MLKAFKCCILKCSSGELKIYRQCRLLSSSSSSQEFFIVYVTASIHSHDKIFTGRCPVSKLEYNASRNWTYECPMRTKILKSTIYLNLNHYWGTMILLHLTCSSISSTFFKLSDTQRGLHWPSSCWLLGWGVERTHYRRGTTLAATRGQISEPFLTYFLLKPLEN